MNHIRLFEHPGSHADLASIPAIAITGTLPNTEPLIAYEARLSILNLGLASAEVVSVVGALPPGATVTVDNAADQVVVAWPAYQANVAPIPNADFEQGDRDWIKGPGWSIVQDDVNDDPTTPTSAWAAKFANQGGNVELRNAVRAAVTAGQPINASCRVQQGASSATNAGAAVRLFFQPTSGAEVMHEGNLVDSGSNSEWKSSTLNTVAPVTGTVQIGCRGKRHRQNKPLWVDNFAWDVTQPSVGTNGNGTWTVTIRIRDTLGREAEWTGSVEVRALETRWWLSRESTNEVWSTTNIASGVWEATTRSPALPVGYLDPVQVTPRRAIFLPRITGVTDVFATGDLDGVISGVQSTAMYYTLAARVSPDGIVTTSRRGGHGAFWLSQDYGDIFTSHPTPDDSYACNAPVKVGDRWVLSYRNISGGNLVRAAWTDSALPNIAASAWNHVTLPYSATASSPGCLVSNGAKAFLAHPNGRVMSTANAEAWVEVYNHGAAFTLNDCGIAVGEVVAFVIDQNGNILVSQDGGTSFVARYTGRTDSVYALSFADGVLVASYATSGIAPRYSLDYGTTWADVPSIPFFGVAGLGALTR